VAAHAALSRLCRRPVGAFAVTVGNTPHEVDFRGDEKAKHCHDAILWHMVHAT